MTDISEEDLEKVREENEKLRSQIAAENSKASENEAARLREHQALQLAAENERLHAELDRARAQSKVGASKEAASAPLQAAKEQLQAAQALANQPVGPVDPNPPAEKPSASEKQNGGNN